ncbi:MAG: 3-isopropylmalate dehydratase large subunit [Firmicutes bacterium]|jgi:3-isopropylmalate/(R)-2-methylmalate dehydratase large subunit|nr:3-isopropylmalate dehydratase large subunit [Bacillota bacterium]
MTAVEKILAAHAGLGSVRVGETVWARVDWCLANDITAPLAIEQMSAMGRNKVFDPGRVILVPDHFLPARDIDSAVQARKLREFAHEQGIKHYYELGRMGVEHALVPELGVLHPGDLMVGADSHTCTCGALGAFATGVGSTDLACAMALGELWLRVPPTYIIEFTGRLPRWVGAKDLALLLLSRLGCEGANYAALEFTGETVSNLPADGLLTLCNMAVEAGAKAGIVPTGDWRDDEGAEAAEHFVWDVSDLEPQVACPFSPDNVVPIGSVEGTPVDQVVIGSCTNGRLIDLVEAAAILAGRKVHPRVRMIVIPATQRVYLRALRAGLIDVFLEAGAAVSTPTCGPCLGGHTGVLAPGEVCLATTNRNFRGRMGHPESRVYLAGPAVAAATAVAGAIVHPGEVIGRESRRG